MSDLDKYVILGTNHGIIMTHKVKKIKNKHIKICTSKCMSLAPQNVRDVTCMSGVRRPSIERMMFIFECLF